MRGSLGKGPPPSRSHRLPSHDPRTCSGCSGSAPGPRGLASFCFPPSKDESGFAAPPLVSQGVAVVAVGYDIAPKGRCCPAEAAAARAGPAPSQLCPLPRPHGRHGAAGAAQHRLPGGAVLWDQVGHLQLPGSPPPHYCGHWWAFKANCAPASLREVSVRDMSELPRLGCGTCGCATSSARSWVSPASRRCAVPSCTG